MTSKKDIKKYILKYVKECNLDVPKEFWNYDNATLAMMTNGCGPGKLGDFLVPDTLWGVSIKAACIIHDFMYCIGETELDKTKADKRFKHNMLQIINKKSKIWILKVLRRHRAMLYYDAVAIGGGDAFKKASMEK